MWCQIEKAVDLIRLLQTTMNWMPLSVRFNDLQHMITAPLAVLCGSQSFQIPMRASDENNHWHIGCAAGSQSVTYR
jgi:hypothetical protein